MTIGQRLLGDVTILTIDGDIIISGTGATPVADTVRNELLRGHARFVLDMGRVRYVDSAGLGELMHALTAVRNRGGAMRLANVTKRVNDLLVVAKLLTVFDCYDTQQEALASFAEVASTPKA